MTLNLTMSHDETNNPSLLSPLSLAFIGDTVFDLLVKEQLINEANRPVGKLHSLSAGRVCAGAQAIAAEKIWQVLNEEEQAIFKRGRNAHTGHTPKNASEAEYHAATGLEALFGWLYLKSENTRLQELFELICKVQEQ
ncbi:MAG: ribonuclease III domain-containing protein [Eubacteriales bacterium]